MLIEYRKSRTIASKINNNLIRFNYNGVHTIADINCVKVLGRYQWVFKGQFTAGTYEAILWANKPGEALQSVSAAPELGQLQKFTLTQRKN